MQARPHGSWPPLRTASGSPSLAARRTALPTAGSSPHAIIPRPSGDKAPLNNASRIVLFIRSEFEPLFHRTLRSACPSAFRILSGVIMD